MPKEEISVLSYKDLIVWKKSIELVVLIYQLTEKFPREELYGLTAQTRRAAVSIPCNISEGSGRGTRRDYGHFIGIAYGSAVELETLIEIAKRVPKTKELQYAQIDSLLSEVGKMLNTLRKRLYRNSL
jgi:four helix bundle protein